MPQCPKLATPLVGTERGRGRKEGRDEEERGEL